LIQPEDDARAVLDAPAPAAAEWQKQLAAWVKQIVADRDLAREDAHPRNRPWVDFSLATTEKPSFGGVPHLAYSSRRIAQT
jgi:hypothetical protein